MSAPSHHSAAMLASACADVLRERARTCLASTFAVSEHDKFTLERSEHDQRRLETERARCFQIFGQA